MRSRIHSSKPPSLVVVSTPTSAKSVTVKRGATGGYSTCAAEISPSQNTPRSKDGTSCLLSSDFRSKLCLVCGFWCNNPAFVHHLEPPVTFLAFLKSCWMVEFRTVLLALPTQLQKNPQRSFNFFQLLPSVILNLFQMRTEMMTAITFFYPHCKRNRGFYSHKIKSVSLSVLGYGDVIYRHASASTLIREKISHIAECFYAR